MITTTQRLAWSFPQLADILVENSVYLKCQIKCMFVLFNDDNIDSS
jgi:hypothetical protein